MGIETAIMVAMVGAGVTKGVAANQQGKAQADAAIKTANLQNQAIQRRASFEAKQKARQAEALAGQQKLSFLSSGLEYSGSAKDVVLDTLYTGQQDVGMINRNAIETQRANIFQANQSSSNYVTAGRNQMFGEIMGGVFDAALFGAASGMFSGTSSGLSAGAGIGNLGVGNIGTGATAGIGNLGVGNIGTGATDLQNMGKVSGPSQGFVF